MTANIKISDIPDDAPKDIEHSGVKGMKWGVRKDRARTGPVGGGYAGKKVPRKMTEDELKATVARLKLEKEYRSLTTKQKGEGHKFLTKMLTSTGTVLVGIIVNHYLGDPLKDALNTKKASKTAVSTINTGSTVKKAKKASKVGKIVTSPKIKVTDYGSFT